MRDSVPPAPTSEGRPAEHMPKIPEHAKMAVFHAGSAGETTSELRDEAWKSTWPDGFIAFIGSGENSRGQFPKNLTELNADCYEFAVRAALVSSSAPEPEKT